MIFKAVFAGYKELQRYTGHYTFIKYLPVGGVLTWK